MDFGGKRPAVSEGLTLTPPFRLCVYVFASTATLLYVSAGAKAGADLNVCGREKKKERNRAQTLKHTVLMTADVVTSSEKNVPRPIALLVLMELSKINGC